MFVDPAERDGDAYRAFWAALRRGEHQAVVAQEMSASMQAMTGAVGEISRTIGAIAASTRKVDAARLLRDASRSMAG